MSEDTQQVEISAEAQQELKPETTAAPEAKPEKSHAENNERKFTPEEDALRIKELREENKQRRLENKRIESALTETQKRLQDIEAKTQERLITAELKVAAQKYKLRDFGDAKSLADLNGVKVLENGDVVGVDEAIAALKDKKPYLFDLGTTTTIGNAPARSNAQPSKDVRSMDSSEFKKAKANLLRGNRY
jgi:hypothetical protein